MHEIFITMISVKGLFRVFIFLGVLYLAGILFNVAAIEFYLKPALMLPLIIAAFIAKNFQNKIILAIALVFSWTGDTLLLFVFKDSIYFVLGLIAFLTAHIFYIVLFTKELKRANGKIELKKSVLPVIIIYLAALLLILIPHLGGLTIPVIIYAIVISTMLYMACLLSFRWPKPASTYLFTGAVSFILSDSILAVNKFYNPIPDPAF